MADTRSFNRILRNIKHIKDQADSITSDTPLSKIRTCISLLKDEWTCFQNIEKTYKGKFDENNLALIEEIEENHFEVKQVLVEWEKICEENNVGQSTSTMDDLIRNQQGFLKEFTTLGRREADVRLPRLSMPTFDGKYSEFPSFRDAFETTVHRNTSVAKIHKFQYLKSLLKGEAFLLINHINVTEANYDGAWDKIINRYDKRKHAVHALLKQFMEQPTLTQRCAKSLRKLCDTSDEVIRGLKVLGEEAESRDPWIIYMLLNRLDADSKEAWAEKTTDIDFPSLIQFFEFLNKRCDMLETLNPIPKMKYQHKGSISMTTQSAEIVCPLCASNHYLGKCEKYITLPVSERKELVATKKLCFNCLASNHQAIVCRSRYPCRICKRKHHTTLHMGQAMTAKGMSEENSNTDQAEPESTVLSTIIWGKTNLPTVRQAILPTVSVLICDRNGNLQKCRGLLDSGSQSTFVSEDCARRLRLPRQRANISITGITSGSVVTSGRIDLKMRSLYDPRCHMEVNALIIKQLPAKIPSHDMDIGGAELLEGLEMADPDFRKSKPIDILIGADRFFMLLEDGRKRINGAILQKTIFGWIVSGNTILTRNVEPQTFMSLNIQLDIDIDKTLRQFWEIEDMPQATPITPEDQKCQTFYTDTVKRQEDGRYVVQLPFRKPTSNLGDSLMIATRRFLALERKLEHEKDLKLEYSNQIREYITKGHMVKITSNTEERQTTAHEYYLPHHAVGSGVSLNDILMVGPTIQPTLWSTLIRFRSNRIALTADIQQMYRQVIVKPEDTDYQRVLWREDKNERIRHYKLTRVTFGLSCSAYLAIRTLQKLAQDDGDEEITQHVLNDFYVDDLLSGARVEQDAAELKRQITATLKQGGFVLRKWQSNIPELCEDFDKETTKELGKDHATTTVLGLHWHACEDALTFRVDTEREGKITKRKVISEASRVFDPLGLLSPSIILLKILFQQLWLIKIGWDDDLPAAHIETYRSVRGQFKYFEDIKIPRFINHYEEVQIHGFADASEVAYCAVIYSRSTSTSGEVTTIILTSKTKVVPIKKVSLP